jgi:hypothetical protein
MMSEAKALICPHCGAENRASPIVTTCSRCGGALVASAGATPAPDRDRTPRHDAPAARAPQAEAAHWSADAEVGVAEDDDADRPRHSVPLLPPPRPVPGLVRLHCVFGGVLTQMGWFFLGFGMVFVWVFGAAADVTPIYFALGRKQTVDTVVASTDGTAWTVNEQPVYAHRYRYVTPDGVERLGTAYAVGRRLDAGSPVTIEYVSRRPDISRVQGMGGGILPLWAGAAVLIFPLIGLGFILGGLRRGLRGSRLLAVGRLTTGMLQSKQATNTRVNGRPVFRLAFRFTDPSGSPQEVVTRTHEPERLEDQRREPLLYDPMNPAYAVMLDSLPGSPRIDETGHFASPVPGRAVAALLVPVATAVGHSVYVLVHFVL